MMKFPLYVSFFAVAVAVSISKTAPTTVGSGNAAGLLDGISKKVDEQPGNANVIPGIRGGKQWTWNKADHKDERTTSFSVGNFIKQNEMKATGKDYSKNRNQVLSQSGKVAANLVLGEKVDQKSRYRQVQDYHTNNNDLIDSSASTRNLKKIGATTTHTGQDYSIGETSEKNTVAETEGGSSGEADWNTAGQYKNWLSNRGRKQEADSHGSVVGDVKAQRFSQREGVGFSTLKAKKLDEDTNAFTTAISDAQTAHFADPEATHLAAAGPVDGATDGNQVGATKGLADGEAGASYAKDNAANWAAGGRRIKELGYAAKTDTAKNNYQAPLDIKDWIKNKYGGRACKKNEWAGTDGCHIYCNLDGETADSTANGGHFNGVGLEIAGAQRELCLSDMSGGVGALSCGTIEDPAGKGVLNAVACR